MMKLTGNMFKKLEKWVLSATFWMKLLKKLQKKGIIQNLQMELMEHMEPSIIISNAPQLMPQQLHMVRYKRSNVLGSTSIWMCRIFNTCFDYFKCACLQKTTTYSIFKVQHVQRLVHVIRRFSSKNEMTKLRYFLMVQIHDLRTLRD